MHQEHRCLQERLGITFKDQDLLRRAFVHRSYLNESRRPDEESNERLEFLGDAAAGHIVAEYLFHACPQVSEGELTARRSAVVRRETLATAARRLNLGACLLVGRGAAGSGHRERDTVLAATFEALLAAIFLDQGLEAARSFLLDALGPELAEASSTGVAKDAKSLLQERAQAAWRLTPSYQTIGIEGPDIDRTYRVRVALAGQTVGEGTGTTKQQAQQLAAGVALERLGAGWQPSDAPTPSGRTRTSVRDDDNA